MSRYKDGWHMVYGYEVYVEDGYIIRGVYDNGFDRKAVYPYKRCSDGSYRSCDVVKADAFRKSMYQEAGRYILA